MNIIAADCGFDPVNNMTIVYEFFTDGYSIYCDRKIYK